MFLRTVLPVLSLVFAGMVASSPAAADCPTNSISICGQTTNLYSGPAHGDSLSHCYFIQPDLLGDRDAAGYDIPAGLVWCDEKGNGYYSPSRIQAQSHDLYRVVGPPSATPITGTAFLATNGWGSCNATGTASFNVQGVDASASFTNGYPIAPCNAGPPLTATLTLPISANVAEPFDVSVTVALRGSIDGYAYSYLSARLSFAVPPGYAVVSCNGFGAGSPVGVQRASWGRLKTIYR
jgi:hypothetical protein